MHLLELLIIWISIALMAGMGVSWIRERRKMRRREP
jgi:hypothetical protein